MTCAYYYVQLCRTIHIWINQLYINIRQPPILTNRSPLILLTIAVHRRLNNWLNYHIRQSRAILVTHENKVVLRNSVPLEQFIFIYQMQNGGLEIQCEQEPAALFRQHTLYKNVIPLRVFQYGHSEHSIFCHFPSFSSLSQSGKNESLYSSNL